MRSPPHLFSVQQSGLYQLFRLEILLQPSPYSFLPTVRAQLVLFALHLQLVQVHTVNLSVDQANSMNRKLFPSYPVKESTGNEYIGIAYPKQKKV